MSFPRGCELQNICSHNRPDVCGVGCFWHMFHRLFFFVCLFPPVSMKRKSTGLIPVARDNTSCQEEFRLVRWCVRLLFGILWNCSSCFPSKQIWEMPDCRANEQSGAVVTQIYRSRVREKKETCAGGKRKQAKKKSGAEVESELLPIDHRPRPLLTPKGHRVHRFDLCA